MNVDRRTFLARGLASTACLVTGSARAQPADTIRIGLITDMSGVNRDVVGPTSVACAQQAIEEFTRENPDFRVELLVADHLNKADVGVAIVREWLDRGGVDAVLDFANTVIALGTRGMVEQYDRASLVTTAGSSDLTGKDCSPNMVQWSWDSWCIAHSTGTATVKAGGDKWFFITADFNFGHAAQADATRFVEAAGGKVLGSVKHPYASIADFSSYLLQAQASGANVIALANSGADAINCVKQAHEFQLVAGGQRLVELVGVITSVLALGLPVAQGILQTETFYWDLNERTRSFMQRVKQRLPPGVFPGQSPASNYSVVLHYLKAVKALGVRHAKESGRRTIEAMKLMPTDDDVYGQGYLRVDGRKIHPAYLFEVKRPDESRYPGDVYKLVATTPAEEAFRPLAEGKCPLVKL